MASLYAFILGVCAGIGIGILLQKEKDEDLAKIAYEKGRRKEISARFGDSIRHRAEIDELKAANEYLRDRNWNRRCVDLAVDPRDY